MIYLTIGTGGWYTVLIIYRLFVIGYTVPLIELCLSKSDCYSEPFEFDHEYAHSIRADLTEDIHFKVISIPTLIAMKKKANRARDIDDIEHLELILSATNEQKN